MPFEPKHKTQKQISQRYWSNLKFYQHLSFGRKVRFILTWGTLFIGLAAAITYWAVSKVHPPLEIFYTTGDISQPHSSFANDCEQCHDPKHPISPLKPITGKATAIDLSCERCHTNHTFHQPDVVVDHSCTACHHEHLGSGPMEAVKDSNCLACHGNADLMSQSADKAAHLPASMFAVKPKDHNIIFFQPDPKQPIPHEPSPAFQAFDNGHPEFQLIRDKFSDPNTLKFNHMKHFSTTIPMVEGKKLENNCEYCHQVDSRGAYMQAMTFAKNCQACHSLQIEPTMPADFQVPHPDSTAGIGAARNFLLTIQTQYANYAMDKLHMTQTDQINAYVDKHMAVIRQQAGNADQLVNQVFLGDANRVQFQNVGGQTNRALFPGCAYCHEVKVGAGNVPVVTPPVTPDRWMPRAKFSHGDHGKNTVPGGCVVCHSSITNSSKTSDVNIPAKDSCVTCHSVKGGVVSACVTCHGYHNVEPTGDKTAMAPLRAMMLGNQ